MTPAPAIPATERPALPQPSSPSSTGAATSLPSNPSTLLIPSSWAASRSLRTNHPAGNASRGLTIFNDHLVSHCIVCHNFNAGTDQNLDFPSNGNCFQPIKNPPLRLAYQRDGIFNPTPGGDSLAGFGLAADGSGHELHMVHPYDLDLLDKPPLTGRETRQSGRPQGVHSFLRHRHRVSRRS